MDNSNYTPSELIDLALDCELDSNQTTSLFELLARDTALQEEFRQAVAIRRALTNDVLAGVPTIEFTQALFQRAGVEMPGDMTPTVLIRSGFKWSTLATTAFVFLGIGIAAALGINRITSAESAGYQPLALPKLYSMNIQPSADGSYYYSKQLNTETDYTLSPFHTPTYHHNQKQSKGPTDSVTIMPENNGAELSVGLSSDDITTIEQTNSMNIRMPYIVNNQQIDNINIDYSSISNENSNNPEYYRKSLSVQLRGIFGIKFYNNESSAVPLLSPFMNNIGATLKYELSDIHAIGFEVGQESFPSIIETSDGRLQPSASIAWTGISYQYTLPQIKLLSNISPFIQVVGGGTGLGPIAKGIVGVAIPIKNRMSIFTAAEGTVLGYRYHSNWYSSQKISFCTGLDLKF